MGLEWAGWLSSHQSHQVRVRLPLCLPIWTVLLLLACLAACFGCGVAASAGAGAPCGFAACLGVASALGGGPSAFAGAACAWAALAAGAFAVAAGAPAPAGAATASVGAACATATASARLGAVLSAAGSSFSFSPHHPWLSSPLPDHPQLLPQSCHQLMAPQGFSVCGVLGLRAPQTAAVI